ncbi:MAG: hypothetical protein ACJAZP_003347, partial [Psychromonas sp.]|uniref:OmpA family protein n=1 Tax=Psychromonas sp. TaxID=1884585 RepID=UPI0039E2EE32
YNRSEISNWDLSAQRANSALRTMEAGGLKEANITQVIGMADTKPIDKVDKLNSINRRVEVIVLARHAIDKMNDTYGGTNELYDKLLAKKSKVAKLAMKNKPVTRMNFVN